MSGALLSLLCLGLPSPAGSAAAVSAAAVGAAAADKGASAAEASTDAGQPAASEGAEQAARPDAPSPVASGDAGGDAPREEAPPELSEQAVTSERGRQASWLDSGHEYATNRAHALAQWMDDFFGAPVRDAERADTFIRAIFADDWNRKDGHDLRVRLRGQVSLPKISERVDLIFSGEEAEQTLSEEQRAQENDVGVRFNFRDSRRTRVDATLSLRSGPAILPGLRFRYQQPIGEKTWARATQRFQYHSSDGYRALTNFDLNRSLGASSQLRWGGRLRYREDREFWDWNTGISYRRSLGGHQRFPSAVQYFATLSGRDKPESFNTSYRIGMLYRKRFLRDFLYFEVEPSYDWRRDEFEDKRAGVFGMVLRLEIMLDDELFHSELP